MKVLFYLIYSRFQTISFWQILHHQSNLHVGAYQRTVVHISKVMVSGSASVTQNLLDLSVSQIPTCTRVLKRTYATEFSYDYTVVKHSNVFQTNIFKNNQNFFSSQNSSAILLRRTFKLSEIWTALEVKVFLDNLESRRSLTWTSSKWKDHDYKYVSKVFHTNSKK